MALSEEIKKYHISYYGGGNSSDHAYRAIIKLRRADNTLIGAAYFHRSASTMPDRDSKNDKDHYLCHYHESDYPNVLDLLRNEKPVFFEYIRGASPMGNIATDAEPVGEGESVFR